MMDDQGRTTMNRQTFMSVAAMVSVVSGLAALLAPAQLAAVFGVKLDDVGVGQERLLGAAYLGYAAIVWFARDVRDVAANRAIALGNVLGWALSLVVTIAGIATGLAGTQAWLLVAADVVFTAGWGYFAFIDRTEMEPAGARRP
jgi:hypothetical protein